VPAQQASGSHGPALAGGSSEALPATGQAGSEAAAERLLEQAAAEQRLLVGGTTPPLDAPLAWLHAHLHAPDFFLYIVLHISGSGRLVGA
jgi:autophagy-related protein 5